MTKYYHSHIAVIDPATKHLELDAFNRMVQMSPTRLSLHAPALFGTHSLFDPSAKLLAIIIMGSGASVYDPLVWQDHLRKWLKRQIEQKIPVLGLCYGHQLLAQLFGGKIEMIDKSKKKLQGKRLIKLEQKGFWGPAMEGPLIVSHREHVVQLGPYCSALASSTAVPIEAFRHDTFNCWGFQAHPEAGPGFVRNQKLEVDDPEECFSFGGRIMRNFFEMVSNKS